MDSGQTAFVSLFFEGINLLVAFTYLLIFTFSKILDEALNLIIIFSISFKVTWSAIMNIFRKKNNNFLLKLFVKIELSYAFTINQFTTAENCMEK